MASRIIGVNMGAVTNSREIMQDGMLPRNFITHDRTYIVIVDYTDIDTDDDDNAATDDHIWNISGLPALYSSLYGKMFLRNRKATEISTIIDPIGGNAAGLWHLDYHWDNELDWSNYQGILSNDPTLTRAQRRWRTETEEEDLVLDAETNASVTNPVGERIAITRPTPIGVLTFTRYETWPFDQNIIAQYLKTVNYDELSDIIPIGCALMSDIESEEVCIEGGMYQKTTYTVKIKYGDSWPFTGVDENLWMARPLCEGTKELIDTAVPGVQTLKIITDGQGNPCSGRLSTTGRKLLPDEADEFLEFNRFRKETWSALLLDFS